MKLKKRLVSLMSIALVMGFVATGCSKTDGENGSVDSNEANVELSEEEAWKLEPAYGKTIKVGYNGGACLGTFGIAHVNGYYEAQGLETEIVKVQTMSDALGTGQVDVGGDHIATMLVPAVNGVNMEFTTGVHTGCKSLYTLTDSGIDKTKDLIGKNIAVHDGIGASDHNIALRFLKRDNINPADLNFKVIESSATILALQKGETQAALLSDQFAKKFVDEGLIKPIRSLTWDEDFKNEPCCIHAINRDFLEKNPITAKKITRAHEEASQWMHNNMGEAVKVLIENDWATKDYDLVFEMLNTLNFTVTDEMTGLTLGTIIDDYKMLGLIDEAQDTEKLMDYIWNPVLQ